MLINKVLKYGIWLTGYTHAYQLEAMLEHHCEIIWILTWICLESNPGP